MTRDAPGAVLRVIDAERELCPDRGCPSPSLFFYKLLGSTPVHEEEGMGGPVVSERSDTGEDETGSPYPVWWSHGYELESLDQVDARLRRSFWSGMDLGIGLSKGSYDDYVEAEAKTCVELEALTRAGYGLPEGRLHLTQMHHLLRCRVIARLGTARPADRSFLRNFPIDEASTREALVAFGLVERDGAEGATHQQVRDMILTDGLGKLLAVDLVRAASGEVDVWAEQGRVRIRVEARGDFTGDGTEDLLMTAGARKSRYRPDLSDLCLVTRETPGAPLRLIDVAPYSCRDPGKYGRPADDDD